MKQPVTITLEEDLLTALLDLKVKLRMRSLSAVIELFAEAGLETIAREVERQQKRKK